MTRWQLPHSLLASFPVDYPDDFFVGDVHEDSRTVLLQLEAFRVSLELEVGANAGICGGINSRDRAFAVTQINSLARRVIAQVVWVSVGAEIDLLDQCERRAIVDV